MVLRRTYRRLRQAVPAIEKLRAAVAARHLESVGSVTVSVGLASPAEFFVDPAAALAAADTALYAAKRAGRNRVMACNEIPEPADALFS